MAVFNPNVPNQNDPNYLGYSKVIEAPPPDKSTGLALETAGNAIKVAGDLTDTFIKKGISDEITKGVDKERDSYTSSLQTIQDQMQNGLIPGAKQPSLVAPVPDSNNNVPANLQSSLQQAETLSAARADGKINDTYYTQRLNTLTQNVRAEYPGYRDYIDAKVSSLTGMNPANAYYKNLMADINAQVSKKASVSDEITKKLLNASDLPDQDRFWKLRQAGQLTDQQAIEFLNKGYQVNYQNKIDDANWQKRERSEKLNGEDASQSFNVVAERTVNNQYQNVFSVLGLGSPEQAMQMLHDSDTGAVKITPEQKAGILQALQTERNRVATMLSQQAQEGGYTKYLGAKGREDVINASLGIYDRAIDSVSNDKYGSLFSDKIAADAIVNKGNLDLIKSPMGGYLTLSNSLQKYGGQNWSNVFDTQILRTPQANAAIKSGLNFITKNLQVPDDQKSPGAPSSLGEAIKTLKDSGVQPGTKAYDQLIDNIKFVINNKTDAPDSVRLNAAHATFNPKNFNILDNFQLETYDPTTGKTTPGSHTVFNRLTAKENSDSLSELNKKDPTIYPEYRNWADNSFKKLFQDDILSMTAEAKTASNRAKTNAAFSWKADAQAIQDQGFHVTYNSSTHQFGVQKDTGEAVPANYNYAGHIGATIARLNEGIRNMSNVYKNDPNGGDINAMLISSLRSMGLNTKEVTGIPADILRAVELANTPMSRKR